MKYVYDEKTKVSVGEPETVMEAVESLEEFLIDDFGQKDWSTEFIKSHFKICKTDIERIILNQSKGFLEDEKEKG